MTHIISNTVEQMYFCTYLLSFFYLQPEGYFIEWKAEEMLSLETPQNEEWDLIDAVHSGGYNNNRDRDADSGNNKS